MKKILALILVCCLALSLVACGQPSASPSASGSTGGKTMQIAKDKIKVGFLYVGPIGDAGYSYAHDQGRLGMEKALGVPTMYLENVPETSDCEKSIRDLIDQGCNVIIATSYGHMQYTANVAKDFPDIVFMHCSGEMYSDNMNTYFGRMFEVRYLSGIVAGLKTKAGKIGYVAAMQLPEVIRGINAFTLGVRSVNPGATVEVVWTNAWYDPAAEKAGALELLNKGCDVMAQHCDTPGPQVAAQEKGAFAVGYNAPTFSVAPNAYLTAPLWDWSKYYTKAVQQVIDGTWKGEKTWESMQDGLVFLDELSKNCAEGTQAKVDAAKAKLLDGSLKVFAGPLKDNTGADKVPAGSALTDDEIWGMMWFVEGVIGSTK